MRPRHITIHLVLAVVLVAAGWLRAEVPPQSREQLEQSATHVIDGAVTAVYARDRGAEQGTDTAYLIELKVSRAAKGEGPKPGEVVYVRTWRAKERPAGWVGPGGQSRVPAEGDVVRAYLRRADDGGYDALLPNGIDINRVGGAAAQPATMASPSSR